MSTDTIISSLKQIEGSFVRIIEQPARSAVRFRYECEGRSAGPIPGVSSSPSCATYPTIQIMNYEGIRAMVMVSCVTVSPPYRQHPHHLVGRVGCHNGICTMIIDNSDHVCTFTHLGIQCAKRNEISSRLKQRKLMQIDPTNAGFDHVNKSSRGFDLGCVCLCFQVYLEGPETGKFEIPLKPVVSDPVYDKKLLSKLTITDISTNSILASGGKVMIFCNYIDEDDIEVMFFECDKSGVTQWQCLANLKPPFGEVYKRVGMSFMAPSYRDISIIDVVQCFIQLRRISDHEASDPIVFYYLPICHQNCPFVKYLYFKDDKINNYTKNLTHINCRKKNNKLTKTIDQIKEFADEKINNSIDLRSDNNFNSDENIYNLNGIQSNRSTNNDQTAKNMFWNIFYEKAEYIGNQVEENYEKGQEEDNKNYYPSIVGIKH